MYTVEIKHPNPAIGAKNKKAQFSHFDDTVDCWKRWVKWLDAIPEATNQCISKAVDADGYVITVSESSTNTDEEDYDTRN